MQQATRPLAKLLKRNEAALGPHAPKRQPQRGADKPIRPFIDEKDQADAQRAALKSGDKAERQHVEDRIRVTSSFGQTAERRLPPETDDPRPTAPRRAADQRAVETQATPPEALASRISPRNASGEPGAQSTAAPTPAVNSGSRHAALGANALNEPEILPARPDIRTPGWVKWAARGASPNPVTIGLAAALAPSPAGQAGRSFEREDGLTLYLGGSDANRAMIHDEEGFFGADLAGLTLEHDTGDVFISGVERIGPVARVTEGGWFDDDRLDLLQPDLFDGAVAPGEAERRAKRAAILPLIIAGSLGGRLPGFGEGVEPLDFGESVDADPSEGGAMVTPIPEEPGPSTLATPDESARIAAELREAWVKGGFEALPEELRGPQIVEIRAPEGGLNDRNAWEVLDQVRGKLNATPLQKGGVRRKAGPATSRRSEPMCRAEKTTRGQRLLYRSVIRCSAA